MNKSKLTVEDLKRMAADWVAYDADPDDIPRPDIAFSEIDDDATRVIVAFSKRGKEFVENTIPELEWDRQEESRARGIVTAAESKTIMNPAIDAGLVVAEGLLDDEGRLQVNGIWHRVEADDGRKYRVLVCCA